MNSACFFTRSLVPRLLPSNALTKGSAFLPAPCHRYGSPSPGMRAFQWTPLPEPKNGQLPGSVRILNNMGFIRTSYDNLDRTGCGAVRLRHRADAVNACIVFVVAIVWSGSSGCEGKPAVVATESLVFPVVLITGTAAGGELPSRADVVTSKEDLGRMRVGIFSPLTDPTRSDPPFVIDSTGLVCEMRNLKGERGGLWMMANPTGLMPITFTLVPCRETGIGAAQKLVAACRYLGPDLDENRRQLRCERIRQALTMDLIMAIIDEAPAIPESVPGQQVPAHDKPAGS